LNINLSVGFIAYLISTLLFLAILIITFIGQRNKAKGKPFFLLIIATFIWSSLLTMSQIEASLAFEMIFIAELLRYYTWFYVIQHVSGSFEKKTFREFLFNPFSPLYISLLFILSVITLFFNDFLINTLNLHSPNIISLIWMFSFSVIGMMLVEQLFRNTPPEFRRAVNFLCISAGSVFIFDFFVFSNAVLLQKIDYELWSARGFINVLIAPTLILAAVRNPSLAPNIHISRQFIFHSTTLIGSGLYLLFMSIAGYYIKINSGEWGPLLQATFLFAALLLLATLFFSSKLKANIKRYVSKSFINKYDYREEWNKFSSTLLTPTDTLSIHLRSLKAVCQIVDSAGARLWIKEKNQYIYRADWKMPLNNPTPESSDSTFINYIIDHHNIFTVKEYKKLSYFDSKTVHWFLKDDNSWLILPLWLNKELYGFIHLMHSVVPTVLTQEDEELLTTITHQVALFLSQYEATIALQQAEKFHGINQMTAFLTHDLKTLLSQLFLLVENGKVHKDNPEFVEDMLKTLEHVSKKMQRLIQQLKNPSAYKEKDNIFIFDILNEILTDYKQHTIQPEIVNFTGTNPAIIANKNELQSTLKHIIQNAVDSVSKQGFVKIELASNNNDSISIKIIDNGKGMSAEFIANRLFQPFDSTKGVSGMGIGVYQSREYIRTLKGDIQVTSAENSGTTFTITLPLHTHNT